MRFLPVKIQSLLTERKSRSIKNPMPTTFPWGELGVDVVLECTGFYTKKEKAQAHINAGAKRVVISAPAGNDLPTIVYGVNEGTLKKLLILLSLLQAVLQTA